MKRITVSLLTAVLLVSLVSCNLPGIPNASPQIPPEMHTAAALTVQAVLTPLAPLGTPTPPSDIPQASPVASPTGNAQPTGTLAATKNAAATITPTYSVPMLTINESTNCRSGPGQDYEIVFTFLSGYKAEIVGQYPQDNYWLVKLPDNGGTCWAWGGYATTSGSYWVVPTLTAPPTSTPAAPDAPTGLTYQYACDGYANITVTLKWTDRSSSEEGFRVLRDGNVIAELPPNTTTYTDTYAAGSPTTKVSYSIVVFQGSLTAQSGTITFSCQ